MGITVGATIFAQTPRLIHEIFLQNRKDRIGTSLRALQNRHIKLS
jgi:hypothetical protein